uniref:Uncharacterized protein n=1 Tax=Sphaerodactylus townsendi TaxID=933632 RepID=A0ACB8E6N1_9SAUR
MALELFTAEEGIEGVDAEGELRAKPRSLQGWLSNLTLNRSPYHQSSRSVATERSAPTYRWGPVSQGGPRKSFKVDFDGNPDELAFFLIQVDLYMEVHVGLVEEDVLEIYNLEWFLLAQRQRFEGPLAEEKAWGKLQCLWQGNHSVSEFATDFRRLASRLRGWPELVLVQLFKDALHPKVLQWALIHCDSEMLMEWIRRAGDAEQQIRQVEQLEHGWIRAQRQLLQTPEKAMDNKKTDPPNPLVHTIATWACACTEEKMATS